jgi:hypothetical protein
MTQPTIKVLGAYKVEITDEETKKFLQENFGKVLTSSELKEKFLLKQDELSSVVALEVSVTNADMNFDVGDFRQPDSDQVAYDEIYLSTDGHSIESLIRPNDPNNFRVYFFLHFYDKNKPLLSSYGMISVPEIQPLPEYLKSLHPFTPVD